MCQLYSYVRVCNWAAILLLMPELAGCGNSALPPPVKVSYRDSIFGAGKVAQIKNDSAHHLYNVRVTGREYDTLESASVRVTEHLAPHASVEVGWLEFGSWCPAPGESLEIYADNYLSPYVSVIPY